jgi:hypothetical protein
MTSACTHLDQVRDFAPGQDRLWCYVDRPRIVEASPNG